LFFQHQQYDTDNIINIILSEKKKCKSNRRNIYERRASAAIWSMGLDMGVAARTRGAIAAEAEAEVRADGRGGRNGEGTADGQSVIMPRGLRLATGKPWRAIRRIYRCAGFATFTQKFLELPQQPISSLEHGVAAARGWALGVEQRDLVVSRCDTSYNKNDKKLRP
jgi:hypothetical protein